MYRGSDTDRSFGLICDEDYGRNKMRFLQKLTNQTRIPSFHQWAWIVHEERSEGMNSRKFRILFIKINKITENLSIL